MNRLLKLLLILLPGIPISVLIIKQKLIFAPFVLILSLWFLLFLIASSTETKRSIKVVFLNMALIMLIFGCFELYFWRVAVNKLTYRQPTASLHKIEGKKFDTVRNAVLGYALRKNSSRTVTGYYNNEIIYKVTYTVDKNGLRVSPPPYNSNAPAILFFGGSFTYGENVNDDEAMPYKVGILTDREYAIYNFSIHGHGPQHMLAEIEHGIVDSTLTHEPKIAIYQAIPEHVNRLKGLQPLHMSGPHYTLNENGDIIPSSISISLWTKIKRKIRISGKLEYHLVRKSFFYNTINRRILRMSRDNNKQKNTRQIDINTFTGVVHKSKDLLAEKYPGIEFHVIYWDNKAIDYNKDIVEALEDKDIKTHKISDFFKDVFWTDEASPYSIPNDGHPSPLMHKIVAEYVVNEIIEKE